MLLDVYNSANPIRESQDLLFSSVSELDFLKKQYKYGELNMDGRTFYHLKTSVENHKNRLANVRNKQIPKPITRIDRKVLRAGTSYLSIVKVQKPIPTEKLHHAFGRSVKTPYFKNARVSANSTNRDHRVVSTSNNKSKLCKRCRSRKPIDIDQAYRVLRNKYDTKKIKLRTPTKKIGTAMILEATGQKPPTPTPVKDTTKGNVSSGKQRLKTIVKPRSPLKPLSPKSSSAKNELTDRQKLMIKAYKGKTHTRFDGSLPIVDKKTCDNNLDMIERLLNVKSSLSRLNRYIL